MNVVHCTVPRRPAPPGCLVVVYTTHEIEREAWDIFVKYETAGFSYTDCVSFAVMRRFGLSTAFTFDSHFDIMGFRRL